MTQIFCDWNNCSRADDKLVMSCFSSSEKYNLEAEECWCRAANTQCGLLSWIIIWKIHFRWGHRSNLESAWYSNLNVIPYYLFESNKLDPFGQQKENMIAFSLRKDCKDKDIYWKWYLTSSICPFVTSHLRFWQNLLPSFAESAKRGQKLWWDITKIFDEFTSDSVPPTFPIHHIWYLMNLKILDEFENIWWL